MGYNIRDAFKSLEEIDDDIINEESTQKPVQKQVVKRTQAQVKLNENKLNESKTTSKVRATNRYLLEDSFNLNDSDSVDDAKELLDKNKETEEDNVEMIVDVNAESEEDLKDSYIGSIIIECPVCKTKIYKDREELTIDGEENDESKSLEDATVNVGEACPHCKQEDGFVVIGKVAPIEDTSKDSEIDSDSTEDAQDDEEVEDDENVESDVNTDDSEGVEDEEEVEDTSSDKEFSLTDTGEDEEDSKEPKRESLEHLVNKSLNENNQRELDVNIKSIDEKSFNTLVERYLREVYDNIDNYTTSNVQILDEDSKLILEGKIKFKSGKETSTKFVFEANEITKHHLIKFKGINETFSKSKRAFTLHAQLNESKLISKHLTYDYLAKSVNESKSTKIYGRVSNLERTK